MKLSKEMFELLNEQVRNEFGAAYLYLSMAADFESKGFNGFSNWMKLQAQEETEHAMKIYGYMNERGAKVKLLAMSEPQSSWSSCLNAFKDALGHEQKVTAQINHIFESAQKEKDYATMSFIKWFVDEQVEEESNAEGIIEKFEFLGEDKKALYMLDKELGQRQ